MSFDTQKQIAFSGIKNSELQAINMATQTIKLETKAKAYSCMLNVLKQIREWEIENHPIYTTPRIKDIIMAAEISIN